MSAPKPRVFRTAHRWTWVCECGASDPSPYGLVLHRLAMDDAIRHSRTHTAERVADGLRRSGDEMARKCMHAHDEIDRQRYADGASAYYESAFRVLRHLVN